MIVVKKLPITPAMLPRLLVRPEIVLEAMAANHSVILLIFIASK
jgi:hypothetical protein